MMGPEEIERASMAVIGREMGAWAGPAENLPVLKRVIHTTADFDFVRNLLFSAGARGAAARCHGGHGYGHGSGWDRQAGDRAMGRFGGLPHGGSRR